MFMGQVGHPSAVLLLDCSASTMSRRLQQRALCSLRPTEASHRDAQLRVEGFCGTVTPVATYYDTLGLLHKVSITLLSVLGGDKTRDKGKALTLETP